MLRTLTRFLRREDGSYAIEAVLMFPILMWGYLGMFIFFDAFRQQNVNLKASYTLGDMLSRETREIDQDYIDGLNKTLDYLTHSRHDTHLRVTVLVYDQSSDDHVMVWSRSSGNRQPHTQSQVDSIVVPRIPVMADAASVIVVETWAIYEPMANVGIPPVSFENFVVTSPRFAGQLKWEGIDAYEPGFHHDDGTGGGSSF